jgi:pilus assembly protein Flp/PilA
MWLGGDEMVMVARSVASRVAARVASEEGATAVEYALMVALIAMAVIAAVTLLGQNTNSAYSNSMLTSTLGS